jgi:hypothetical protein
MTTLEKYLDDGANWQAQGVLAYLRYHLDAKSIVSKLTDTQDWKKYDFPIVEVGRFENCREQGYVLMVTFKGKRRNYAFFEHRNSDELVVFISDKLSINTPSIDDIYGDRGKYDHDMCFERGQIVECAEDIMMDVESFLAEIVMKDKHADV